MVEIGVLLVFFAVILFTYVLTFFWKRRRLYELAKKLPGHNELSFLGSLIFVVKISLKDYISKLMSFIKDDATMAKFWFFEHLFVVSKDAEFINKIFNSPETYNKSTLINKIFPQNLSLPILRGNEHKSHRKILNKAFTTNMLQQLPQTFDDISKKILLKIDEKVYCGEFEVMDYVGAYSLESFGLINLNYQKDFFHSEIYDAMMK